MSLLAAWTDSSRGRKPRLSIKLDTEERAEQLCIFQPHVSWLGTNLGGMGAQRVVQQLRTMLRWLYGLATPSPLFPDHEPLICHREDGEASRYPATFHPKQKMFPHVFVGGQVGGHQVRMEARQAQDGPD